MRKGSSDLLLLDVNVLLAMAWPNHQFHADAVWRLEAGADRWATCALTQLGFIRLSSKPAAIPTAKSPAEAALLLSGMVRDPRHVYLESLPPPVGDESRDMFEKIFGYRQVTDIYLIALARRHRATFVTFDTRLQGLSGPAASVEILGI
ncbi:MAG: PIN domain-containing protein [Acidobacteria bacterium]|nr:PIN domain-containing protein [Acidobacteriota bacterium]